MDYPLPNQERSANDSLTADPPGAVRCGIAGRVRALLSHPLGWREVRGGLGLVSGHWPLLAVGICLAVLGSELVGMLKEGAARSELHVAGDFPGFFHCRHVAPGDEERLLYDLYLPPLEGRAGALPLITFMAGYGERNGDLRVGLAPYIRKHVGEGGRFDFAAFFPTGIALSEPARTIELLDHVIKKHHLDADRVYLTGHSKGGAYTWNLASLYPDRWAAIAPVCNASAGDIERLRRVPCWVFQGTDDISPKAEVARALVKRLRDAGGEVRYTEYPGEGHLIWPKVYFTPELYTWFGANKRR